MIDIKGTITVLALALFVAACGQAVSNTNNAVASANTNSNQNAAPASSPAATIDQGEFAKGLYAKNCAICHKDSGKGGKVTVEGKSIDPDDLTTAKMKERTDDKLAHDISEGAPDDGMPAFKEKLNPDQIKAVVRHLRVLQGS